MSTAFASTCALVAVGLLYARVVVDAVGPGAARLALLAPVLALNVAAPLLLINPASDVLASAVAVTNFAWWTNFKVLALAAGRGQLTGRTVSAPAFLALAALPVKLAEDQDTAPAAGNDAHRGARGRKASSGKRRRSDVHTARDATFGFLTKLACLAACVAALPWLVTREHETNGSTRIHVTVKNALYAFALYFTLGVLFDLGALLIVSFFGVATARHFDLPFLATSFGDFWGARWNLVAGGSLREVVYDPIAEGRFFVTNETKGRTGMEVSRLRLKSKRRRVVGIFACFAASGVVHECIFWALEGRSESRETAFTGEWFAFFFAQAPMVAAEYLVSRRTKRGGGTNPKTETGRSFRRAGRTGAFLAAQLCLANALFFPQVARNRLDARVVEDVRRVLGLEKPKPCR